MAGEVCEREGLAPGSIARHLASIAVHHRAAGHPSPTRDPRVLDVLSGVRRHPGVAPPRRVAAALTEQVQAMVTGLDGEHDPAAARDTALILLGYTAALRRSELAALTLADITEHPDGAWIEVFLASSKTDQHRQGHTTRIPATGGPACPVAAWTRWRTWLTAADQARGEAVERRLAPAFRRVRKGRPASTGEDGAPDRQPRPGGSGRPRCPTARSPRSSRPAPSPQDCPEPGQGTHCGAASPPRPTPPASTNWPSCATAAGAPPQSCAPTSPKPTATAPTAPSTPSASTSHHTRPTASRER